MKPIKINADNAVAIERALAEINGRSTAHAYTSIAEIIAIASTAEKRLETLGISKKDRPGVCVCSISGGRVANTYKYPRQATRVTIERKCAAWYLINVAACTVYKEGGSTTLMLTPTHDAAAVHALRSEYSVQKIAET